MNLRIVHLLSEPTSEREARSIAEVSALSENTFGYAYTQCINEPYDGPVPPAREANDRGFDLGQGHYGCFLAQKNALDYLDEDVHAILICEADCVFTVPTHKVISRIWQAYIACVEHNIPVFTFGYRHDGKTIEQIRNVIIITQLIETHCLLIPRVHKAQIQELFDIEAWDTADFVYTVRGYDERGLRIGTFADRPIAVQCDGVSLVDGKMKTSAAHYSQLRYD